MVGWRSRSSTAPCPCAFILARVTEAVFSLTRPPFAAPTRSTRATRIQTTAMAKTKAKKATGTTKISVKKARGPTDPLWLPNTERPGWLDGSLPGDRGFDPLGLSKPVEYLQVDVDQLDQNAAVNKAGRILGTFTPNIDEVSTDSLQPYSEVFGLQRFRECELMHGRWAMLGALGVLACEFSTGTSWADAIGLEYGQPQYANFDLPFDINNLAVANSVLMLGIELLRNSETDLEKRLYPGGAFDPLNLATDNLKEAEIKHGRLAMVACLGFGVQALAFGTGALDSISAFAKSF